MSDREDDRRIGVNSSALFFGNYAPVVVIICFTSTAILLGWLGVIMQLNFAFWLTLLLATAGWIWQYIRLRDPKLPHPAYGEMFRQNVWIGFVLLAGAIAGTLK